AEVAESFDDLYTAILDQVNLHAGHDLRHYKVSTLRRRIARRLSITGVASLAQYSALLRRDPDEAHALFQDSLVSVTSFFRDPDAYTMLERDCIPQLFAEKGSADNVRVWVVGCATGQEAYSVAIQLVEYAAQVHEPPRLQVFATDLDEAAIAFARRGIYPKAVAEEMTSARLERYFALEENGYRIKPEIREHVLFAVHDLLKDPPFSNLDLISCRNVLIYFNREAQSKAFAIFHYALNRERVGREYLFLGTSESVDAAPELFTVIDKHCHLFQRRDVVSLPRQRQLPSPMLPGERPQDRGRGNSAKPARTLEELYTAWSLRVHTPPRLLVNSDYEITHLFGDVRRYLQ
ncbi:MAG: protein-glutamate O-methyltransferase CheR, partial [Caldilineaceae bacterium]|nr:protein-glutamate O-methyltransferase CheR [Caldilineaceae bacterium]